MAINKINSKSIEDLQISADDLANGTISLDKLSATGTKDANTFLRGDGTFASAGSPSIDDNGNSTAVTIDSSENFIVGTTTAQGSSGTTISQTGDIYASKYASTILTLNRTTTDGNIAEFEKDGTTRGIIATESDGLIFSNDTRGIKVRDDACLPRNVNLTTADNIIDLGTSGSRFKDLYLGGGLYVGGTGAANKLDDYEEGTWTPTLTTGTSAQDLKYTKIGNVVHISGSISFSSVSGSGVIVIGGLPFTSTSYTESYTSLNSHAYKSLNIPGQEFQTLRVDIGSTNLRIIAPTSNGTTRTFGDHSHVIGSSFNFRVAGFYLTDA